MDIHCIPPSKFLKDTYFYKFLLTVVVVAALGAYIVYLSMKDGNYDSLVKPSWSPPPAVFGVVWTILYLIIAYATYRAYKYSKPGNERTTLLWIYVVQLILNFLWVFVFFLLKNPRAARILIFLLLAMIVIQMVYMYHIDRSASYMFFPYFIWVCYAAYLNWAIVDLNQL